MLCLYFRPNTVVILPAKVFESKCHVYVFVQHLSKS